MEEAKVRQILYEYKEEPSSPAGTLQDQKSESDNKLLCACCLFTGRREDSRAAARFVTVRNAGTWSSWKQLNQGTEMRDEMIALYRKISL